MAGTIDLTVAGSTGTIGGAVFTNQQSGSGTGIFDTFVQLQHNGVEQGYNTDANAQFDEKSSRNFNHSILLADVPIVVGDGSNGTQEGVVYREFLFDANEVNGAGGLISLDKLQIWQEEAGNLTNFSPGSGFAGAHTNYLAYDLDAGGDHWVAINSGLSSGSGKGDMRVLIPDSYFINDAAHRYVTLYSEFGLQGGAYGASSGFEEWGLSRTKGSTTQALVATKTAAVPGGTADTVGETIDYSITVANVGNANMTGITVTDPGVSNLAAVTSGGFNVGDVNLDGILNAGETWRYTAQHVVTQADIDTDGGGDGTIDNTVTADSDQTTAVTASASVAVEQRIGLALTKTADVSSVDEDGDEIRYTIAVSNSGNTTSSGLVVTDPQITHVTPIIDPNAPVLGPYLLAPVFDGDYNVGDTNENGVEDPGETFQYQISGDDNNNGVEDPGEVFTQTNVGDTNQNGIPDSGEEWQFYNAGDTNQNGVEDDGEIFQIVVDHNVDAVDANDDGYNDGDTNQDGILNPGETWLYSVTHTVTQDEIDNGGVVQPGLTIDNTATVETAQGVTRSDSESVTVVQNPDLAISKTADVASVDAAGDVINYTVVVDNAGNMTLTGVSVTDSLASLTFAGGDADNDGKLDVDETWTYTASYTVTQADIDNGGVVAPGLARVNTATADAAQTAPETSSASVAIVQDPDLAITKTADVTLVDGAGDVINYTVVVDNTGNMTLTGVSVSDSLASLTLASGDTDNDGKLDLDETWTYTGSHTVTQAEMDTGGTIANTASVTTGQGAGGSASASVGIVQNPSITLDKTASVPGGAADTAGEVIDYTIDLTNNGNVTLTGVSVTDAFVSNLTLASGDDGDGVLDVGETWHYTANHTVTQAELDNNGGGDGVIQNTASVTTAQGASASDSASVTVVQPPPPQTFSMTLEKEGFGFIDNNNDDVANAGDTLVYHFTVHNTGTGTLTDVQVNDTDGNVTMTGGILASLAGGADSSIWEGEYTITSLDVSAGEHINTAVANSNEANASSGNVHTLLASLNELIV
ncbi:MAG TPA: hypothetical protein VF744_17160 [Beijerinckiaceae bacterium]|jgi:uncharacterized repeat protein (TIGR01451 family)